MQSVFDFDPTFPHSDFRVGFIGSHCVGKTKQIGQLAKVLRVPTITECARHMCAALGYRSIADVPDMVLFQWKVLQWQIRHEQQYGRFLSDRSTIDNAAYFIRFSAAKCSRQEASAYLDAARRHAESYTHLIYFPVMWDHVEDDGFRGTDVTEREEVDDLVKALIRDFDVAHKTYTVTKDDMKDGANARLLEILEHLQLYQTIREKGLAQA